MKFIPFKFGDLINSFGWSKLNTTEAPNSELLCFNNLRTDFLKITKNSIEKIYTSNQFQTNLDSLKFNIYFYH